MNPIYNQSENCRHQKNFDQRVKNIPVNLKMVFGVIMLLSTMTFILPSYAKQKTSSAETRADVLRRGTIECQRRFGKIYAATNDGGWYVGKSKTHWTIQCSRPGSAEGRDNRIDIPLK